MPICSTEFPPLIYGGLGVYVDEHIPQIWRLGQRDLSLLLGDGHSAQARGYGWCGGIPGDPVPIRDGLEIFLSPETLSWGEGLRFLQDLFSLNQLSAAISWRMGLSISVWPTTGSVCSGAWQSRGEGIPMIYHVHGLEVGRSDNPNPQLVALEKKGAEVADQVITVSEAMKQELATLGDS